MPSAAAANALQRPSGARPRCRENSSEGARCRHDHHAAGEGQRALAGAQRLPGQVQGDEGGRAGGVHADRRAFQAEGVGHPAGEHARVGAGAEQSLVHAGDRAVPGVVALVGDAREDAGVGTAQGERVDAGPFGRLPRDFEEQPLLRVHRQRLARADAEELGVEVGGVVQEAALAQIGVAGPVRVGVVEAVEVPAAVGGEVADDVAALGEQPPQVLGSGDATGEAVRPCRRRRAVRRRGRCGRRGGPGRVRRRAG